MPTSRSASNHGRWWWSRLSRNQQVLVIVALIGAFGAIFAGVLPVLLNEGTGSASIQASGSSNPATQRARQSSGAPQLPPTASPSSSTRVRRRPTIGMHWEITDNRLGTQVFSDPQGDAVQSNQLIPFDTQVLVKCWASNQSGMGSINSFYLVETSPWTGDYAPANTFANGDPIGKPGSTAIDARVLECK